MVSVAVVCDQMTLAVSLLNRAGLPSPLALESPMMAMRQTLGFTVFELAVIGGIFMVNRAIVNTAMLAHLLKKWCVDIIFGMVCGID